MDNTYRELLEYIDATQKIATCALQQLDKNAEFHIVDSMYRILCIRIQCMHLIAKIK